MSSWSVRPSSTNRWQPLGAGDRRRSRPNHVLGRSHSYIIAAISSRPPCRTEGPFPYNDLTFAVNLVYQLFGRSCVSIVKRSRCDDCFAISAIYLIREVLFYGKLAILLALYTDVRAARHCGIGPRDSAKAGFCEARTHLEALASLWQ
ncbi:hypothetical protein AB1N83_004536 [Pleurotus pulmonarius]